MSIVGARPSRLREELVRMSSGSSSMLTDGKSSSE